MTKAEKLKRVEAFKTDILAVCEKHNMTFIVYRYEDDWTSEEGLEVCPGEPYQVRNALMADSGYGYLWKKFK